MRLRRDGAARRDSPPTEFIVSADSCARLALRTIPLAELKRIGSRYTVCASSIPGDCPEAVAGFSLMPVDRRLLAQRFPREMRIAMNEQIQVGQIYFGKFHDRRDGSRKLVALAAPSLAEKSERGDAAQIWKGGALAPPLLPFPHPPPPRHIHEAVPTACFFFAGPGGSPHHQNPRALIKRRRAPSHSTSTSATSPQALFTTTTRSSGASNKPHRPLTPLKLTG